ncbi:hypothetical protein CLU79DRAFT_770353 [Phycomyces nitens]|nr:hypothetical protein CLU79DRAFT_770353 [Phycomyces nitens]
MASNIQSGLYRSLFFRSCWLCIAFFNAPLNTYTTALNIQINLHKRYNFQISLWTCSSTIAQYGMPSITSSSFFLIFVIH